MLARASAGETLTLTGVKAGSGTVSSETAAKALTGLVSVECDGTSSAPAVSGGQVSMIVEIRNDVEGGLDTGFLLSEFGVFAKVGDDQPALLYYAALGGDKAQQVLAYSEGLDVHRFPVAIAVTGEIAVTLGYPAGAFVTQEELEASLAQLDMSGFVQKAGDTMTGPLVLPGDPTASLQAAPKQYVDNALNDITPSGIGAAPASHTHAATDITSGVLPLARGGTGGASAAAGLYQLVNNTTALTASGLSATDCFGIADVSAGDGKKLQLGQLTTYLLNNLGAARIQTGSYVGTGTYGSSNPCRLQLDFKPQLFILFGKSNSNTSYRDMIIAIRGDTQLAFTISHGSNPSSPVSTGLIFSWGSKYLTWYASSLNNQLNASGVTYNWLVAGA